MNSVILFAALISPNAAPPIDPKVPVIEKILVTPEESLAAIEKALAEVKEGDEGVPRGWKAEFLRLWKTKGVRRVNQEMARHLKENFTLGELKALLAMKKGEPHPLEDRAQRRLERKLENYQKAAQKIGSEVGAELGEEAERKLKKDAY